MQVCCAVQNVTTERKHSLRSLLNFPHFGFRMWLQTRYHVINPDLFLIERFPNCVVLILINRFRENRSL